MTDKQLIRKLLQELEDLQQENVSLRKQVRNLESRLLTYEHSKNSTNSSIAPSQDPYRVPKSLRVKSNRKPGGQKGHKGHKLKMVSCADTVVVHDVTQCEGCGNMLDNESSHYDARQVFDIPPISVEVTEHRRLHKSCSNCGRNNIGIFPKGLKQEAQYGEGIKSLCVYLQNYQMLPFARCKEFIEDLTGHRISTGSLSNFQKLCFNRLQEYQKLVKQLVLQSPVLHADETGIRLNGNNSWMHVLSNKTVSLFGHHLKRGKQAMNDIGILQHYTGNLVHDRFSSYFSYNCRHSLCNAHILRDLIYVEEAFNATWARKLSNLLIKAKKDKEKKS